MSIFSGPLHFALQFETDTVFHADDSAAVIKLGRPEAVEAAFIKLRPDSGDERVRNLLFSGDGSFVIRQPIELGVGDSLANNHKGPENTGLVLDLIGNQTLTVPTAASFVNYGRLILKNGGLALGDVLGGILNKGILTVPEGSKVTQLDCTNEHLILLKDSVIYGDIHFISGSKLRTTGGTFEPKAGDSLIKFDENTKITAEAGTSKIVFPNSETPNLEAEIEVLPDASLELKNATIGRADKVKVAEEGELIFNDRRIQF